jgi:hypothetical protein
VAQQSHNNHHLTMMMMPMMVVVVMTRQILTLHHIAHEQESERYILHANHDLAFADVLSFIVV